MSHFAKNYEGKLRSSILQLSLAGALCGVATPAMANVKARAAKLLAAYRPGVIDEAGVSEDTFIAESSTGNKSFPAAWDWRNRDGRNYFSPVKDQGDCGSCVAFAAIDTLEATMNIQRNTPISPLRYSRQHLFSCGGGQCRGGMLISDAVTYLAKEGVPDEACLSYTAGASGNEVSCTNTCADAAGRSLKLAGFEQPTEGIVDVAAIKAALMRGPLLSSMILYEDLYYYTGGVYKHTTGRKLGSHAVTLVGWNDQDQAWIARNSWGSSWGDEGYFKIAWDDQRSLPGRYTWLMHVPNAEGHVSITDLAPMSVLRGQVQLRINSTFAQTNKVGWILSDSVALPASAQTMTGDQLDTTAMADGVYYLTATAHHAGGVAMSQPLPVIVNNHTVDATIVIDDGLVDSKIFGIRKIAITTTSALPFTEIRLVAKHLATGKTFVRSTNNTAERLSLLWATPGVPDGDYELTAEGEIGSTIRVASTPVRLKVANN